MIRFRLIAALAVLSVAPGAAQVMQQIPPVTPMIVVPQFTPMEVSNERITKVMTLEEAQAQIAKLQRERREANTQLKAALAKIEDMTKYGGSLVQAYCETATMSRNTAGATEDCAATGYGCDQVSGTCRRQATGTIHCAPNFVYLEGRCVGANSIPQDD